MINSFVVCIFIFLSSILGVNFFVYLERKVLGYAQFRKGPEKRLLYGFLHSFRDAVKLFKKSYFFPLLSNYNIFFVSRIFTIYVRLFL